MPSVEGLLLGEVTRSLDDRFRLSLPGEMVSGLTSDDESVDRCLLAKERRGCLSLWNLAKWQKHLDNGIALVRSKIEAGKLDGRVAEVQQLGRLLSTRHREVPLAGRGRLVIPEGFREFLGVEPGGTVVLVGAAVCVEIWHPDHWAGTIGDEMPTFRELFDQLSS
ncbi:division/cell wall cluster transcriptional repressor MraZ [Aeoliella mucimassa]|uniref:Transcriptional regulator MraZ n=1 Tax=Aeoliella mucimassa TaxID=2527972 RepID=A0A518ATM7_9BACT|nr:division/cell wall cluster transcriptional repressor MraZ [Aeoliella mucimassa]QDU58083.1 MraZ-like protein [Aeoliella mucimassa]